MSDTKRIQTSLSLLDATMVVAGSMINSVFLLLCRYPQCRRCRLVDYCGSLPVYDDPTAAVLWETSGMYPKAGGQYVY